VAAPGLGDVGGAGLPEGAPVNRKGLDFLRLDGELLRRTDLSAEMKLVLAALGVHLSSGNGRTPGVSLLAEELGLARRSVIRIIGRLERAGLLAVSRAMGSRNLYTVETGDSKSKVYGYLFDTLSILVPGGDPKSPVPVTLRHQSVPKTGDPKSPSTKKIFGRRARRPNDRRWLLSNFFRKAPFPESEAERGTFLGFWAQTFGALDYEEELRLRAYLIQGKGVKNPPGWCVKVLTDATWSPSDECLARAKAEMTQGVPVLAEAEMVAAVMKGSAE